MTRCQISTKVKNIFNHIKIMLEYLKMVGFFFLNDSVVST
jgi:hypothetical protein